jgi:Mg2+ and Co2+ transporter CorA
LQGEPNITKEAESDGYLPRSLYVPKKDPRGELREIVNSILSDNFMIFLSLVLIPIILLPFTADLSADVESFLDICDWTIVGLFVAEYTLKLYLAQDRWQHFKSPWHLIDLVIVVLPFIQFIPMLELGQAGSSSLLLRLLRVPRALAVGGRALAGRRANNNHMAAQTETGAQTEIRQVGPDLKTIQHLTWDELKVHLASSSQDWIDIHNLSDEGFSKLSSILEISEPHFKSRLVDDIYPHIDYVQHASFIFVQSGKIMYPEHSNHFLTISRSGIIVICSGTNILTVSRHDGDLFSPVLSSLKDQHAGDGLVVPVLYGILEHMLNQYRSILSEIEMEVIKIGGTPRSKLPKDFLERIYQLNKEVSRLLSNIVHFKELLSIITSDRVPLQGFDERSEEAFHVLQDDATYLNEIANDLLGNLHSIIDLYINQTSFETNRILKILAVITSLSVVPSAVGGILGMNLLDMPYGVFLWQVVFIIWLVMAFALYVFVKLGWLKS